MRTIFTAITTLAFAAVAVQADPGKFKSIIGDAANIQQEAQSISSQLKMKNPDFELVKTKSGELKQKIQTLRDDLAAYESQNPNLAGQMQKDWELVKTKAELLLVFSDTKDSLLNSGDPQKNRSMLRAYSDGIAKRAAMLQQTAKRLDR